MEGRLNRALVSVLFPELVFAGIFFRYMTLGKNPKSRWELHEFFPALDWANFFFFPNFLVQEFFFVIVQPPHSPLKK